MMESKIIMFEATIADITFTVMTFIAGIIVGWMIWI